MMNLSHSIFRAVTASYGVATLCEPRPKFILFNASFTILNAKSIILDAKFIILDAKFIQEAALTEAAGCVRVPAPRVALLGLYRGDGSAMVRGWLEWKRRGGRPREVGGVDGRVVALNPKMQSFFSSKSIGFNRKWAFSNRKDHTARA